MQTRHQVAILAAGLLVGAQLGIASIGLPIPDTEQQMEPVPPAAQVLESDTATAPEAASTEPTVAAEESVPAPVAMEPVVPAATPQPIARHTSPFPPSTDDVQLLPAVIAYLDSTAHLRLTGASGGVFPASTDDKPLLPAVIAYFDRLEATRLAAQAQRLARSNGNSTSPAATDAAANQQEAAAPAGQPSTQGIAALDSGSSSSASTQF